MEEYAYILDYLPQGLAGERGFRREPLAYGLGETEFKILELVPAPDIAIQIGEKVYIGKEADLRDKVRHVKRRIGFEDLTSAAQSELPYIIIEAIEDQAEKFIAFYNNAGAITTRYHALELIPGLGKKTMLAIIAERKKGNFKDFKDLEERVDSIHSPDKLIAKRIEVELSDSSQKYHIFCAR